MSAYELISQRTEAQLQQDIDLAVTQQETELDQYILPKLKKEGAEKFITRHAHDVALFAVLAGQTIPEKPTIPDEATRILRAKLIMEEALETIRGLGVAMSIWNHTLNIEHMKAGNLTFFKDDFHEPNLKEIVDGCLDIRVVTTGTLIACGIPDVEDLQECVDVNHITKFRKDKDGHKRADGKWVKPTDHPAPRIGDILKALGWDGK